MVSLSRSLLRMFPRWCWSSRSRGPMWLSRPQPECRVLWSAPQSLMERLLGDIDLHMQQMKSTSHALFRASLLPAWEAEGFGDREPQAGRKAQAGNGRKEQAEGKYQLSVDVAGFSPEELTVKLLGRRLVVTGKRQRYSKGEDGGYCEEHRELHRETLLPADVDLHDVSCSLTRDGQLSIEAQRLNLSEAKGKAIPINVQQEAHAEQGGPSGEGNGEGGKTNNP